MKLVNRWERVDHYEETISLTYRWSYLDRRVEAPITDTLRIDSNIIA